MALQKSWILLKLNQERLLYFSTKYQNLVALPQPFDSFVFEMNLETELFPAKLNQVVPIAVVYFRTSDSILLEFGTGLTNSFIFITH